MCVGVVANRELRYCFSVFYGSHYTTSGRFYKARIYSCKALKCLPRRHGRRAMPAWQMIKCLGRMGRKGTKTSARRVETEGCKIHPTMPRACGCGGDCKLRLTHRCTKPPRRSVEWLGVVYGVWGVRWAAAWLWVLRQAGEGAEGVLHNGAGHLVEGTGVDVGQLL